MTLVKHHQLLRLLNNTLVLWATPILKFKGKKCPSASWLVTHWSAISVRPSGSKTCTSSLAYMFCFIFNKKNVGKHRVTSQMTTMARAGPGQSPNPGSMPTCPTWVSGAPGLVPWFAVFTGIEAASWRWGAEQPELECSLRQPLGSLHDSASSCRRSFD